MGIYVHVWRSGNGFVYDASIIVGLLAAVYVLFRIAEIISDKKRRDAARRTTKTYWDDERGWVDEKTEHNEQT